MEHKSPSKQDLRQVVWSEFLFAYASASRRIDAGLSEARVLSMDWYDVLLTLKRSQDHRLRLNELADRVLAVQDPVSNCAAAPTSRRGLRQQRAGHFAGGASLTRRVGAGTAQVVRLPELVV